MGMGEAVVKRDKAPKIFAGRVHDMRGPFNSILSVCCEGPDCEICAKERADKFAEEAKAAREKQP
jgi:hypothetical protein